MARFAYLPELRLPEGGFPMLPHSGDRRDFKVAMPLTREKSVVAVVFDVIFSGQIFSALAHVVQNHDLLPNLARQTGR